MGFAAIWAEGSFWAFVLCCSAFTGLIAMEKTNKLLALFRLLF